MESLPEEILFDILLWLPVISLLRFKSVCKSWLTLIESSTFVSQHLHHHSGEDALIVSKSSSRKFCLFSGHKYEINTDIDFDDRCRTTVSPDGGIVCLVDSCNGIICLYNGWSGDVALWNPALKQVRVLPRSSIPHQRYIRGDTDWQYNIIGFGFDVRANDYKVVRIIWHYSRPEVNQVEVCSLRTSFSWRIVQKNEALPFRRLSEHSEHATSKDGTCFWVGADNNDSLLVAFDLKNEVFKTMPLPDIPGSCESKPCDYALDFLNEKLAYIRGLDEYEWDNLCFEIWVLHEFGLKESWNKIYNIGPTPYGLYPTGFSMNGHFVLLKTSFMFHDIKELYLYNFGTEEATQEGYTPIQDPNPCDLIFFLHYNESLISLKS